MKSVLVLVVLMMTQAAFADTVVMDDGWRYTGTVTFMNSDTLKILSPDSTLKTIRNSGIRYVDVATEARADSLLVFARPAGITIYAAGARAVPPSVVPRETTGTGAVVPQAIASIFRSPPNAGAELRSARTAALWGIVLSIVGSTVVSVSLANHFNTPGLVIGECINVSALICEIAAWVKVGNAGAAPGVPQRQ
jgi:hypothetical protein